MLRYQYLIALCAGLAVTSATAWALQKTPSLVFETLTKDFGNVTLGDEVKYVFKFTNKGQGTLEIHSVEPG